MRIKTFAAVEFLGKNDGKSPPINGWKEEKTNVHISGEGLISKSFQFLDKDDAKM